MIREMSNILKMIATNYKIYQPYFIDADKGAEFASEKIFVNDNDLGCLIKQLKLMSEIKNVGVFGEFNTVMATVSSIIGEKIIVSNEKTLYCLISPPSWFIPFLPVKSIDLEGKSFDKENILAF